MRPERHAAWASVLRGGYVPLIVDVRGVRHMVEPSPPTEGWSHDKDLVLLRCGGYTHAPDAAPGVPNCLFCWSALGRWERAVVEIARLVNESELADGSSTIAT